MPHYENGTEARVGDQVSGKLFNTDGIRAGTIISITPGVESCNALVAFTMALPIEGALMPEMPRMCVGRGGEPGSGFSRIVQGEQHGSSGPKYVLFQCADYCDTNKLTPLG